MAELVQKTWGPGLRAPRGLTGQGLQGAGGQGSFAAASPGHEAGVLQDRRGWVGADFSDPLCGGRGRAALRILSSHPGLGFAICPLALFMAVLTVPVPLRNGTFVPRRLASHTTQARQELQAKARGNPGLPGLPPALLSVTTIMGF